MTTEFEYENLFGMEMQNFLSYFQGLAVISYIPWYLHFGHISKCPSLKWGFIFYVSCSKVVSRSGGINVRVIKMAFCFTITCAGYRISLHIIIEPHNEL